MQENALTQNNLAKDHSSENLIYDVALTKNSTEERLFPDSDVGIGPGNAC